MISCRTAAWILAFGRITTKYPYSTLQEASSSHTLRSNQVIPIELLGHQSFAADKSIW